MQLSTRVRYGLRALLDIALNSNNGKPVLLKEISERQNLSRSYVEQLLLTLQASGFIKSIRGKKGGFLLAKPPEEIDLYSVVKTLERTMNLVECTISNNCPRGGRCATQELWNRLSNVIRKELENTTLKDLMEIQKKLEAQG